MEYDYSCVCVCLHGCPIYWLYVQQIITTITVLVLVVVVVLVVVRVGSDRL